ncbi:MAG: dTDP-4-dehydrorhamnose 3,5-epimerase [Phycisphaera sp.]|nr:dTDP-4-dehydrorhamnose 3,5-epimerase [Phycisphaera sp.]
MTIIPTDIPDVLVLAPKKFGDLRGFFSEVFKRSVFEELGLKLDFIQDNHSYSQPRGTVRGLHFQAPPFAQDKLVRVTRGAVLDVAVDIRKGSPTFGRHVAVELSAENWKQMFVPKGFAHGFATLCDDCEVIYKVTAPYAPQHDRGLLWNDPALGIDWKIDEASAVLSDKDRKHPKLAELESVFVFDTITG